MGFARFVRGEIGLPSRSGSARGVGCFMGSCEFITGVGKGRVLPGRRVRDGPGGREVARLSRQARKRLRDYAGKPHAATTGPGHNHADWVRRASPSIVTDGKW